MDEGMALTPHLAVRCTHTHRRLLRPLRSRRAVTVMTNEACAFLTVKRKHYLQAVHETEEAAVRAPDDPLFTSRGWQVPIASKPSRTLCAVRVFAHVPCSVLGGLGVLAVGALVQGLP